MKPRQNLGNDVPSWGSSLCSPVLLFPLVHLNVMVLKVKLVRDFISLSVSSGQICSAITSVHNSSSELLFWRTSGWRIALPSCFIILKFLFHCFLASDV